MAVLNYALKESKNRAAFMASAATKSS